MKRLRKRSPVTFQLEVEKTNLKRNIRPPLSPNISLHRMPARTASFMISRSRNSDAAKACFAWTTVITNRFALGHSRGTTTASDLLQIPSEMIDHRIGQMLPIVKECLQFIPVQRSEFLCSKGTHDVMRNAGRSRCICYAFPLLSVERQICVLDKPFHGDITESG